MIVYDLIESISYSFNPQCDDVMYLPLLFVSLSLLPVESPPASGDRENRRRFIRRLATAHGRHHVQPLGRTKGTSLLA